MILGVLGGSLLCLVLALFFWLPSRTLVHDLRADGVTVVATVIGVDDQPRYVRVRFAQGPRSSAEEELWDYAGMLPDVHSGDSLTVTYDPDDPSHVLPRIWVIDPPTNLPAYAAFTLAALFLAGALVGAVRRRLLLTHSPPPEPA
ncbi:MULTISPECIES: DUF3592 domain-containing protein [Streptomyces]|uniref:DUF3592 domain-containing protein n=1 Tax=Streptomyces edwardsiae TaxID=3075527 RepID=A0ABU2PQW1_9ACTN|nr:DUF3592 domain-containing protein [Streptomyces sp. DSM 41636]MDT0394562.1 hypothetical protein [Streptomyces sp. DSM 41636]